MRSLTLWLPVCLVLFALLGAGLVIADEPPAPPVKPNEKEEPAEPAATDEDAGAEEATTPALDPKQGYVEMTKVVQGLPRGQWSQARKDAATKWLAKWSAGEQTATGEELLYLGRLQQTAEQYTASAKSFQGVVGDAEVLEGIRAQAVGGLAGLLARKVARDHLLSDGVCQSCLESVTGYLTSASDPKTASMRAGTHRTLAGYYSSMKDSEAAVGHHMQAAVLNPSLASASARSVLRDLMGSTHSMDGYKPLRAGANAVLSALGALAQQNLQKAKENLAELKESNADKRRIQQAERNLRSAESAVKLKDRYGKPFELLGTEAPQWTLEHAFGDLQALDQLKGKVVVLDFWATWCPWCIKSFPAIRDVLKDYDGKDLVFVGVTASSSSVYEARYDLDDDLKDKGEAGQRARPVARMVRGTQEPNPEGGIYSAEEYKAKEKEAITTFIANHEMNWPVVMIDKTEPGPKYALMGWPHAVVIDKEGRIRYFKSGALLRDRPEDVKNFRAILDDLLAEPAAK